MKRTLALHLLGRAKAASADAALLEREARLEGAVSRAASAILSGARALLVLRGVDPGAGRLAAALSLFDKHLVKTEAVSRACGEAFHRAYRSSREAELGDVPTLYLARVASICEGAAAFLAEAEIVADRLLGESDEPDETRESARSGGPEADDVE